MGCLDMMVIGHMVFFFDRAGLRAWFRLLPVAYHMKFIAFQCPLESALVLRCSGSRQFQVLCQLIALEFRHKQQNLGCNEGGRPMTNNTYERKGL